MTKSMARGFVFLDHEFLAKEMEEKPSCSSLPPSLIDFTQSRNLFLACRSCANDWERCSSSDNSASLACRREYLRQTVS